MAQGTLAAEAVEVRYPHRTLAVISVLLIGLAVLEYALWLPQYLTWPWWADHDCYATMAQGWDAGLRPYRDLICNNFPGEVYLFWIVGKLCGWGNTWAYNAFDALLLGGFGVAVLAWSRRRFGTWLPGAVTLFALISYYFRLDFCLVAQRDWHSAPFVALAMMVIEAVPRSWGRGLSALFLAIGFAIRPQVVMFLPGLLWALHAAGDRAGGRGRPPGRRVDLRLTASWLVGFAILTGALFLPLIVQGLMGDLVDGLTTVLPGSLYNEEKLAKFGRLVVQILARGRAWGLPLAIALLWPAASASTRTSAIGWLLLFGGAVAYLAAAPRMLPYLQHPFWLVWAFLLGILVVMLQEGGAPSWRYPHAGADLARHADGCGVHPASVLPVPDAARARSEGAGTRPTPGRGPLGLQPCLRRLAGPLPLGRLPGDPGLSPDRARAGDARGGRAQGDRAERADGAAAGIPRRVGDLAVRGTAERRGEVHRGAAPRPTRLWSGAGGEGKDVGAVPFPAAGAGDPGAIRAGGPLRRDRGLRRRVASGPQEDCIVPIPTPR